MRVVVTGLVATYPVGGVAWDYLQYVQGFRALGCDVYYLEDTGAWFYDPGAQTFTEDPRANARFLAEALASLDPALARVWALRGPDGSLHGLDEPEYQAKPWLAPGVAAAAASRPVYRSAQRFSPPSGMA